MTAAPVLIETLSQRLKRVVRETGAVGLCARGIARSLLSMSSALQCLGNNLLCAVPPRFLTRGADRNRLARNGELFGKHRGQRCFILGNGPSLRGENMALLKDEICITVNKGHRFATEFGLRPRYHAAVDAIHLSPEFIPVYGEWEAFQRETNATFLLSVELADRLRTQGLSVANYEVKQYLISIYFDRLRRLVPLDLRFVQPGYVSVIHFAIIAALYMGFRKIYLLGCDMDFFLNPNEPLTHSYDTGQENIPAATSGELFGWDQVDLLKWAHVEFRSFKQLGELARKQDSHIANAGKGGCLNVFAREPLESIFGGSGSRIHA